MAFDITEYMMKKMVDDMFSSGSTSSTRKASDLTLDERTQLFEDYEASVLGNDSGSRARANAIASQLGISQKDRETLDSDIRRSTMGSEGEPQNVQFARTQKEYLEQLLGISTDESGKPTRVADGDEPFRNAFGWEQYAPAMLQTYMGTRNAEASLDTLDAIEFMQGYEMLRGAGAISDAEGARASRIRSRLLAKDAKGRYKLSDEEAKSELERLLKIAEDGIANYEKQNFPYQATNGTTPIEGTTASTEMPPRGAPQAEAPIPQDPMGESTGMVPEAAPMAPEAGMMAPQPTQAAPVPQAQGDGSQVNPFVLDGMDPQQAQVMADQAAPGTFFISGGQLLSK